MRLSPKYCLVVLMAAVAVLALPCTALADGPSITAYPLAGAPPTINGLIGLNEWPTSPQISITLTPVPPPPTPLVIPTYATFVSDSTYLYVLVDAQGDTTANSPCDECLLVFGWEVGGVPQELRVEIYSQNGGAAIFTPPGTLAAMGFTDHRIYEFRVPLSMIGNPAPGDSLQFCSPSVGKMCFAEGLVGSMPYDGGTIGQPAHDNVWPFGFDYADRTTWATMTLARDGAGVPALDPRGALLLATLLAASAAFVLARRSP